MDILTWSRKMKQLGSYRKLKSNKSFDFSGTMSIYFLPLHFLAKKNMHIYHVLSCCHNITYHGITRRVSSTGHRRGRCLSDHLHHPPPGSMPGYHSTDQNLLKFVFPLALYTCNPLMPDKSCTGSLNYFKILT